MCLSTERSFARRYGWEPTLARHGYTPKILAELLGVKQAEIRALFRQTLEPDRARELKEQMLAAGLPV